MTYRNGFSGSAARRLLAIAMLFGLCLIGAAANASPADAAVAIHKYEAFPSDTQAGGHPNMTIEFKVEDRTNPKIEGSCRCNTLRDAKVSFPPGVIGNPHATPRCSTVDFALDSCPIDSQVGVVDAKVLLITNCCLTMRVPLYNLMPLPDQAGLLGFKAVAFGWPTYTVLSARTDSDYGLDGTVQAVNQTFGLTEFKQALWGVPASKDNDAARFKAGGSVPVEPPAASNSPEIPFLQNPTTCVGELSSQLTVTAYDHGVTTAEAPWPATTGCDQLSFRPSLSAVPSTTQADTASGLDVNLQVPQMLNPNTPSGSAIKATRIELPEGFTINPSAADGKVACTDEEARFGTTEQARCPEHSKVGNLTLLSSALPGPISGNIYLGAPKPGDRYRLFLTADGYATHVKLAGSVVTNPETGRLVTDFPDLPQTPFSEFDMHFFGSERGLMATPDQCGTYPVKTTFVPWNAELPSEESTQFFRITSGPGGSPCPAEVRPFGPEFKAASMLSGAGMHTPFSVELKRPDGDQVLDTITVATPPGFSATLRGVPYCSDTTLAAIGQPGSSGVTELNAPSCPAASQIGTAVVGAGAGTRPVYFPGKIYLAGPYKGAPLSLAVVTPGVSGPYDLGNVVVRSAIAIDPTDASITVASDSIPRILEGIPLRLRLVRLDLDRKDFTLNPTNCDPFAVEGLFGADQAGSASRSSHFQASSCDALNFAPKLAMRLTGSMKRVGHPALRATLTTQGTDNANLKRTVVTLPSSLMLDNSRINGPCTRVRFAAETCPESSVLGWATATTPILDEPLTGPVYLRSSSNKLPDLVAALRGPDSQPVKVEVAARIDSFKGGLRTTFQGIPDVAVTRFHMRLAGGKKGLLQNTTALCKKKQFARVTIAAQNGMRIDPSTRLQTACGKSKGSQSKKRASYNSGGNR